MRPWWISSALLRRRTGERSCPLSILWLPALEPVAECRGEVFPALHAFGENSGLCASRAEIVAVLGIFKRIPKELVLARASRALGRRLYGGDLGCLCALRERRKRTPRVVLAARPVDIAGPDLPATKNFISLVGIRPVWQAVDSRLWELSVADVFLVLQRIELADYLFGTEVCGLEVTPLCAVLPGPRNHGGIFKRVVEAALGNLCAILNGTLAMGEEILVGLRHETRPSGHTGYGKVDAFNRCPSSSR